jgi:hypothetical protein
MQGVVDEPIRYVIMPWRALKPREFLSFEIVMQRCAKGFILAGLSTQMLQRHGWAHFLLLYIAIAETRLST